MKKTHHSLHNTSKSGSLLSHYDQLHPKNRYYRNPPDLYQLAQDFPENIGPYVNCNHQSRKGKIDWKNAEAVQAFTQALFLKDFHINFQMPSSGFLCPPLPNRLNYLCWLSDLIEGSISLSPLPRPRVIDVGTGASLVYPLLGAKSFGWEFIGIDVASEALQFAQQHLQRNPSISEFIHLLLVPSVDPLQQVIKEQFLPSIMNRSSVTNSEERNLSTLLHTIITANSANMTNHTAQQELLQQFRGQIRQTFQRLDERYQYRLSDCEYTWITSTSSNSNPASDYRHEDCRESNLGQNQKRSRKREDWDDEEDEDEDDEMNGGQSIPTETATTPTNRRQPLLSAVMTNPPFYDTDERVQENEETVCTGNDTEMKTIGGEIGFITALIMDSLILRESVLWYTAMVGKKSSIGILKTILWKEGIPRSQIFTTVFAQGVTYRWGLAWTFLPEAAALYMSYQLLQGHVQSNPSLEETEKVDNTEETSNNSTNPRSSSRANSTIHSLVTTNDTSPHSFLYTISAEALEKTMTIAEKDRMNQFSASSFPAVSPVLLILEEGKKRLAMSLLAIDQSLSSIHLSNLPEMTFLSSHPQNGMVGFQSTHDLHFQSNFIIQEQNLEQGRYLFYLEIFVKSQNSLALPQQATSQPISVNQKLLVTIHMQLRISLESVQQQPQLVLDGQLTSSFCSQRLTSMIFHRVKEFVEHEFLRSNRRWRRTLQNQTTK